MKIVSGKPYTNLIKVGQTVMKIVPGTLTHKPY